MAAVPGQAPTVGVAEVVMSTEMVQVVGVAVPAPTCARDCDAAAQCHRRDRAAGTGVGDVRRAGHTQARWQGVGEADGLCWVQRWVAHCKGQCAGAADADAGRAEGLGQGRCQGSDGQTLVGHAVGEVAQDR
ncbi:MAG: hypothetical protein IPN04_02840 [Rhodoferax sp.]|nr:hypothetical protein [Rhodoferax sp.]